MATTREAFAGTGKLWVNSTLFSEAAEVSGTIGGKLNRQITLGHTGETVEDPTAMEVKIDGAPLRRNSYLRRLKAFRRSGADVTIKLQVGEETYVGRGKFGPLEVKTSNGKSSFSTSFMGDEQE
ncbi:MAG: hypothetical protein U0324_46980 [Polyangiales bacterium]